MNPLLVESALQSVLQSLFPGVLIYLGTGATPARPDLAPGQLDIIVACTTLDAVAAGLYKAHCDVRVTSPAMQGQSALAALAATLETLRTRLTAANVGAQWPSGSAASFNGLWVLESATSQHEKEWVIEVRMIVGVSE